MQWNNWTTNPTATQTLPEQPIIYIGCMTGTSVDRYADFTAAIFADNSGELLAWRNHVITIPAKLQQKLQELSTHSADTITITTRSNAEAELTEFLLDAYLSIIKQFELDHYPKNRIILSPHGQAINHQPLANPPYTDQIVNGEWLAQQSGYPVVTRHRQAALAVSMAAPLAPALIQPLFYNPECTTVVINGGGIANICVLPADASAITAFDTGPANGPIDELIHYVLAHYPESIPKEIFSSIKKAGYDIDGQLAALGTPQTEILNNLLAHPYFKRDHNNQSADRADFGIDWVLSASESIVNSTEDSSIWLDIITTIVETVVVSISDAVIASLPNDGKPIRVLAYGGMVHNSYLIGKLAGKLNLTVNTIKSTGYDPDFFESLLFAYLAWCVKNYKSIDLSYCARNKNSFARAIPGSMAYPGTDF